MAATTDTMYAMRHSLAHIMATAIQQQWPESKFGVGPVIDNGFYYDVDLGSVTISDEDFATLESAMQKVIEADVPFEKFELPIDEAITWASDGSQPYKLELLNDLKRAGTTAAKDIDSEELGLSAADGSKVEVVSFYKNGDFTDLCRGPHVESTGKVGAFKLMRVSGAYWRGKEGNPQMQRIYGVAFETEKELRIHLNMLEEAKKRDHRRLGKELDLFVFSDLVGSGLPMFTPRGTQLRQTLEDYSYQLRADCGFEQVWTPHITKKELYEKSGHWDKFGEELFLVKSQETSDEIVLRPMNCPHHIQIYASQPRSYRDLPVKYMENATVYRDEKSGELHGLSRVRSITMDDNHAFVREDQIEEVVSELISAQKEMYQALDMKLTFRLSYRDSGEGYLGDKALWDSAQQQIRNLAEANNLTYYEAEGEAAFYGPKIDCMAHDSLGRQWQVATVQLDFVQPERFDLRYAAEDGGTVQPVMIHAALLGSLERFLGVYIEHTAGRFPVWLSPEQIRLITVNQESATVEFATNLQKKAKELGIRVETDNSNESVGKKIRSAEVMKVPYSVVIGEKEIESGRLTPRLRQDLAEDRALVDVGVDDFLSYVSNQAKNYS